MQAQEIVHYDPRPYHVALADAAEITRNAYNQVIERGKSNTGQLLQYLQNNVPADRIVSTRNLDFLYDSEQGLQVSFGNADERQTQTLHRNAARQLASRTNMLTVKVLDNLLNAGQWGQETAIELLKRCYTNIPQERVFVRSTQGQLKAVLSDSYLAIDESAIVATLFDAVSQFGVIVLRAKVTDLKWSAELALPHICEPIKDSPMMYGLQIGHSNFGTGSLDIGAFIERLWCTNLARTKDHFRRVHSGSKLPDDLQLAADTLQTNSELQGKIARDTVSSVFSQKEVDRSMKQIEASHTQGVDIKKALQSLRSNKKITGEESEEVAALYNEPDVQVLPAASSGGSLWRLSNAFSRIAQNSDISQDRSWELERIAGDLVNRADVPDTELDA